MPVITAQVTGPQASSYAFDADLFLRATATLTPGAKIVPFNVLSDGVVAGSGEARFTVSEAGSIVGRVELLATTYDGRSVPPPQALYDLQKANLADPLDHPMLGPFQRTAVKDGRWSDPATWGGSLPAAGHSVSLGTFHVVYDLESDLILKDVFGPMGSTFSVDPSKDTRLRADTIMLMGTTNIVVQQHSPTPGKPRFEIVFHASEAPGASARLGLMTMGPSRILGAQKKGHLFAADMAAGATQITVEGLAQSGWRVGDTLVIVGTELQPISTTDAHYTGPATCYSPRTGSYVQLSANQFQFGQDEERQITAIAGDVITLSAPLAYAHTGITRSLPDGQSVSIKPVVGNVSRSIRFRSATAAEDGSLDANADHTQRQKRAHTMAMFHDDFDWRWVEAKNMARTDNDPSLVSDAVGTVVDTYNPVLPLRASNGGAILTDPINVKGRYAFHCHRTGPHLTRRQGNFVGLSAWAPIGGHPQPGWAITHHGSRAAIEDCVISNVRGAGMVSELGQEIGQWVDNLVTGCRGDGFGHQGFYDRQEIMDNHNGHSGVAYENQARQVLLYGNIAANSFFGFLWNGLKSIQEARSPRDVDLRLWNPYIHGGGETLTASRHGETYGARKAQIPPFVDNICYASRVGWQVTHRLHPSHPDSTMMSTERFHCLSVREPWKVTEYSNRYAQKDCLWVGPANPALRAQGASWGTQVFGFSFSNMKIMRCTAAFGGSGPNYDGAEVEIDWSEDCPVYRPATYTAMNGGVDAATHATRDLTTPWAIHPTIPSQAILSQQAPWTEADLPLPYPKLPYGVQLPVGHPAVEPGDTPYFVLGDGTNGAASTNIVLTITAGQGREQGRFYGIIRDSMGDRRWPDWQTIETFPNGISVKGYHTLTSIQPEQLVQRLGCFMDGGAVKVRLWFRDIDRYTHVPFAFHFDMTVAGLSAEFIAPYLHDEPPDAPELHIHPEVVPAPQPIVFDTAAPVVVSRAALEVVSGEALAHRLRARDGLVRWSIQGGADAAHFAVTGGVLTWAANGTRSTATPQDAGTNNVYEVVIRCTALGGGHVDVAHQVRVLPATRTFATISDDFNRADENLEANPAYLQLVGPAGAMGIRSNVLNAVTSTAATYDLGSLGSSQQRGRWVPSGATPNAYVLMRMVDADNWLGFRRDNTRWRVAMCLAGVLTDLALFQTWGNNLFDVTLDGDTVRVVSSYGSGNAVTWAPRYPVSLTAPVVLDDLTSGLPPGTLQLPPNAPKGDKVGLRLVSGTGVAFDNLVFDRLPS